MIVDENNPTPFNTPIKPAGSSPLRPDVQAAVQKFLHTRSACPPKLVTNNFAAVWALEKEHQRRAMLKKAKWEREMPATSVAPPEQQEDQALFMTNVAHTFLQFMAKTIGPQPEQPHITQDEHHHARDPVEVIYSTPQPTIPAPRDPPQTQAQADSGPGEDPTTYAAQYLAGIVPPASLPPTGNPVNPDAIYESSSSSSSSLDFWMTSGMGYAMPPSSSAGSSRRDESLFSLGSRFSLGQMPALGDDALVSVVPSCSAQALSKSTKLRAEAPVFVPRAC